MAPSGDEIFVSYKKNPDIFNILGVVRYRSFEFTEKTTKWIFC